MGAVEPRPTSGLEQARPLSRGDPGMRVHGNTRDPGQRMPGACPLGRADSVLLVAAEWGSPARLS